MNPKTVVTVSRRWNNPQIKTEVTHEGIALAMSLDDFIDALAAEIGSIALTVRDTTFKRKMREAASRVVSGVKDESAKIV